jgi:5'-3' exonuclease
MGDPTDGIPGVRGLGPKKALKALEKASWRLEEVQELSDPVKRSAADLSLALVDLREAPRPEVPPLSIFQPYGPKDGSMFQNLVLYLRALEIESVVDKLYAGTLWEPRRPA